MEPVMHKWVLALLLFCWLLFPTAFSVEGIHGDGKVRAVNLGGWLVIEGWIKPTLFDGIPNGDMLDGTKIHLKSVSSQKYVCAENGGGMAVTVSRDTASAWETFTLWRVSMSEFQLRSNLGQFWTCNGEGCSIAATAGSPSTTEIFYFERNNNRVHIKLSNGIYLQATEGNQLTADFPGTPGWDDNSATFIMTIAANDLHGDYQLANGYGLKEATEVLQKHRNSFITVEDFAFLYRHGINAVRIPVGWWIAFDPDPPAPFVSGSLDALDNAFSWALDYNIKCIIDLHAAPGSQNGMEHSASRDGWTNWPTSPDYISKSLNVIDFLAKRYGKHPALLGIELLNEPSAAAVTLDTLVNYYKQGYEIVRKYSSSAYVIFCQRIGNADPMELYNANIGSHNVVVDLHYYNLFDTYFSNMSPADNIDFLYKSRQNQLQTLNAVNGPLLFIGEWTNEWDAGNASTEAEYKEFGKAQLEVYGKASFGWSYWTIKNEQNHWDFEWNIKNDYLPFGNISNQLPFGNQTNQMYPMVVLGNASEDRQRSRRLIILLVASLFFFHLLS